MCVIQDSVPLRAAIKATTALTSSVLSPTLYSHVGHQFAAECLPTMDSDGQTSGSAKQITVHQESSEVVDAADMILFFDCRRLPVEKEQRRQCLSEYRFRTGLAIQQELNRREASGRSGGRGSK